MAAQKVLRTKASCKIFRGNNLEVTSVILHCTLHPKQCPPPPPPPLFFFVEIHDFSDKWEPMPECVTFCYTRDTTQQVVSACSTSLPQMRLQKFTKLIVPWRTVLNSNLIYLHDTPTHNDASPYQVWLHKVELLRGYFLHKAWPGGLTDSVTPVQPLTLLWRE